MKLYLVRHGDYTVDTMRRLDVLNEKGTKEIIRVANFLSHLNLHVSNILHSGKFRAQQTAELLANGIVCNQPIQSRQGLDPNDDVTAVANEIAHWSDDVLLVGHLPFMSKLVSKLLTGNENKDILAFKTGTFVCLEQIDRARWMVNWMLVPDLLNIDLK